MAAACGRAPTAATWRTCDNYDAEITAALGIIGSAPASRREAPPLTLMGHSTGGLIAALWADRHPGIISQLVLDSPGWKSTAARPCAAPRGPWWSRSPGSGRSP